MTDLTAPEEVRAGHRTKIRMATRRIRRLEADLERAIAERDQAMIHAHGDPRTGHLSYDQMAQEAGISRGRVIQVVQGKSSFSKRQSRKRREAR